jgi:two-component system LytT family sensor kinase
MSYAAKQMLKGGMIEVITMCKDEFLQMAVADNGSAQNTACLNKKTETKGETALSHTGINVPKIVGRLNFLYPDKHSFKIIRGLNQVGRVQISSHVGSL